MAHIEHAVTRHGRPRRIAIEACCGAADLAERLSVGRGLPVELAHPGYVHRLRRSPDKTDLSDAQLLADLTRVSYLPTVWLAPQNICELRRLMRHRCQLVRCLAGVEAGGVSLHLAARGWLPVPPGATSCHRHVIID